MFEITSTRNRWCNIRLAHSFCQCSKCSTTVQKNGLIFFLLGCHLIHLNYWPRCVTWPDLTWPVLSFLGQVSSKRLNMRRARTSHRPTWGYVRHRYDPPPPPPPHGHQVWAQADFEGNKMSTFSSCRVDSSWRWWHGQELKTDRPSGLWTLTSLGAPSPLPTPMHITWSKMFYIALLLISPLFYFTAYPVCVCDH